MTNKTFKDKVLDYIKSKVDELDNEKRNYEAKGWTHTEDYLEVICKSEVLCDAWEAINKITE